MKTHKGILTVCICIFLSSMCIYKDIISHLYEISKSLIKNMHINSVHTRTEHTCAHKHPSFPPTHTHLCVNELFLWRGQVERSQSFQPKKSIASSWIIEMFAISFFTKKKKESLFNVPSPSILFAFTLWYHDTQTQILTYKSFHSFNDMCIAIF